MNQESERREIYDPELAVYIGYWKSMFKEDEPGEGLVDLAEFCLDKLNYRFKELRHCLDDLANKNHGRDYTKKIAGYTARSIHRMNGMRLFIEEIISSADSYDQNDKDRLEYIAEDYMKIHESQDKTLSEYRKTIDNINY